MFVDDKSLIKVLIYYKLGRNKRGVRVETNLDEIPEEKRAEWKPANFELRPITWKMSNDLMRECRVKNPMTMLDEIDWISYKEKKLTMTVVKWDAKNDAGQPVPVSPDAVMKMHPLIAETLLSEYDKEAYAERDDEETPETPEIEAETTPEVKAEVKAETTPEAKAEPKDQTKDQSVKK